MRARPRVMRPSPDNAVSRLAKAVRLAGATAIVATLSGAGGLAGEPPPATAFVDTYVYACQPVEYDFAGARVDLGSAAQQVHDNVFLGEYKGSCREFYFEEVVPRLPTDRRPLFLPSD